jgi:hypothetical protein
MWILSIDYFLFDSRKGVRVSKQATDLIEINLRGFMLGVDAFNSLMTADVGYLSSRNASRREKREKRS